MSLICYRCAKPIMGKAKVTNPPNLARSLGVDFPKSYHPICYGAAEREAAKKLGRTG